MPSIKAVADEHGVGLPKYWVDDPVKKLTAMDVRFDRIKEPKIKRLSRPWKEYDTFRFSNDARDAKQRVLVTASWGFPTQGHMYAFAHSIGTRD
jgi:hypothetical protein